MGGFLSRWRKKKTAPVEALEKIDKEIKALEKSKQTNIEQQKRWATKLIVYSGLLYVLIAIVLYIYYRPSEFHHKIIYALPLLVFPIIVWAIRKFLHWYFVKRIRKNELALEELTEAKSKMLEEIMETETYKKVKEILEKYAPERVSADVSVTSTPTPMSDRSGQELRRRTIGGPGDSEQAMLMGGQVFMGGAVRPPAGPPQPIAGRGGPLPAGNRSPTQQQLMRQPVLSDGRGQPRPQMQQVQRPGQQNPYSTQQQQRQQLTAQQQQQQQQYRRFNPATPPGPPMPRTVLPRERNVMDRLVEYLVGDGPQNRYALICRQCHSHNGMALREEFEYLAFRCCYCYSVNPARKQKPKAPALPKLESSAESNNQQNEYRASEDDTAPRQQPDRHASNVNTLPRHSADSRHASDDINSSKQHIEHNTSNDNTVSRQQTELHCSTEIVSSSDRAAAVHSSPTSERESDEKSSVTVDDVAKSTDDMQEPKDSVESSDVPDDDSTDSFNMEVDNSTASIEDKPNLPSDRNNSAAGGSNSAGK